MKLGEDGEALGIGDIRRGREGCRKCIIVPALLMRIDFSRLVGM